MAQLPQQRRIKPGDFIYVTCGKGHTWGTFAVKYGDDSWQPNESRCACGGVYLNAKPVTVCGVPMVLAQFTLGASAPEGTIGEPSGTT